MYGYWEWLVHTLSSVQLVQDAWRAYRWRRYQVRRRTWAACRIQALVRGWLDRRVVPQLVQMQWRQLVVKVQAHARGLAARIRVRRYRAVRRVFWREYWPATVIARSVGRRWVKAFR